MKNSVIISGLCLFSSVFAQNVEKAYFENNPDLGGGVIIQSASVKVVGEEILSRMAKKPLLSTQPISRKAYMSYGFISMANQYLKK
ncbi:MAG: hypothetical protein LBC19_13960 [Tannerella sp.]|jgi:hypothetical protein|nr:hypothetical protein [Tannerella sp.]